MERAAWEKSGKEERAHRVTLVCVAGGSLLPSPASLLEPFPALSFSQVLPHYACRHHSIQRKILTLCHSSHEVPGRSSCTFPPPLTKLCLGNSDPSILRLGQVGWVPPREAGAAPALVQVPSEQGGMSLTTPRALVHYWPAFEALKSGKKIHEGSNGKHLLVTG